MKQVPGGTVTSKDDRIVYDANLPDSGIIYGCEISYIGNNMIHINAGYGVMKGGLFEIEDHTEYVEYAKSGSITGQIYLHFDLSADDKLTIVKETTNDLHPMIQDAQANYTNGIYEMQLCTFTATATTLEDVTQTFSIVNLGTLDTLEEIQANTIGGMKAGALAVKQLNNNLGGLQLRVNSGKPEWKASGADTWSPFNSCELVGTYRDNASIDISKYPNSTIDNFIVEPTESVGTWSNYSVYQTNSYWSYFDMAVKSITGNTLTITAPQAQVGQRGYRDGNIAKIPYNVWYISK